MKHETLSEVEVLKSSNISGILQLEFTREFCGNALNNRLVSCLKKVIEEEISQPTPRTKLICLSGFGKHFCTGFDLADVGQVSDDELLSRFVHIELLLANLWSSPIATAAYAKGKTWGAGADLFCATDARWASPEATFSFPGAQFGLVLGTRRLAERIGSDLCRAWVREGRKVSAGEALSAGLVNQIGTVEEFSEYCLNTVASEKICSSTRKAIYAASRNEDNDRDLSYLVHSAARPGLKARIIEYLEKLKKQSNK